MIQALMHELNTLNEQADIISQKVGIVRAKILLKLEEAGMKKFTADGIGTVTREHRETVKGKVKSIADEYPDLVYTPDPKLKVIAIRKVKAILEEMEPSDRDHALELLKITETNYIRVIKAKSNKTKKTTPDPGARTEPGTIKSISLVKKGTPGAHPIQRHPDDRPLFSK